MLLLSTGCAVGPKYRLPSAPGIPAYKESPPAGWKEAQPDDGVIRGKWWEIFNDPELNTLEEQVSISNQNILAAESQFREAKDLVRIARPNLFPSITTGPSISNSRTGAGSSNATGSGARNSFNLPVDFSYQADIWGSIRRSVRETANLAQASFAQLENARLS
jgi:outer membrane protein TolC